MACGDEAAMACGEKPQWRVGRNRNDVAEETTDDVKRVEKPR